MKFIYKIECIKNNKVYIGQTNNYKRRFQEHKRDLRLNKHYNRALQEDYNKYGLNNFKFEILDSTSELEAENLETFYIDKFGGIENDFCYNYQNNITQCLETRLKGAKSRIGLMIGNKNPQYGKHTNNWKNPASDEMKRKISKKQQNSSDKFTTDINPRSKFDLEFVNNLRYLRSIGLTNKEIGKKYNIASNMVSNLINHGRCNPKSKV